MKFPPRARGAVTLSLGQTKDQTVQAVMRLRQLATTQSVTFFAPPEVHQSIQDFRCKGEGWHLSSHDVVCWLLEQTCQGLENLQPLYYAQGVNYCRRTQALRHHQQFLSNPAQRLAYLDALQDHEQQSLKSLYEPRTGKKRKPVQEERYDEIVYKHIKDLERRRKAFQDTGSAVHASALQEVEQEREVAVEAETIREKQRPILIHPERYPGLADELREFVLSGILGSDESICETAFSYMRRTATSLKYPADLPASPNLLVSAQFRRAVIIPSGKVNDDFLVSSLFHTIDVFSNTGAQRPIQWILWSTETAILVSPEEAEELIPLCRSAPKQLAHLLAYAAPVTQKMLHFNNLNYYAVPALPPGWSAPMWLRIQIGIFAGRLYFPFQELEHIRDYLRLDNNHTNTSQAELVAEMEDLQTDGSESLDEGQRSLQNESQAIQETSETKQARAEKLKSTKMLTFLHAWLGTRGRDQDFTHTPMGYLCARKLLTEDHPFFRGMGADQAARGGAIRSTAGETSTFTDLGVQKDRDDHSDVDEEEFDERHKLTEEELRQAQELAAAEGDSVDEAEDGEDDVSGSSESDSRH